MTELDEQINRTLAALEQPAKEGDAPPAFSLRERFYELSVISFGNLFPRMPTTGQMYDRVSLDRVTVGLDDGDAADLGRRTDDWLRLEGLIRQEAGKRAFFLPLQVQAALSLNTQHGLLGDVCAKILRAYAGATPSAEARAAVQQFGANLLRLMAEAA